MKRLALEQEHVAGQEWGGEPKVEGHQEAATPASQMAPSLVLVVPRVLMVGRDQTPRQTGFL